MPQRHRHIQSQQPVNYLDLPHLRKPIFPQWLTEWWNDRNTSGPSSWQAPPLSKPLEPNQGWSQLANCPQSLTTASAWIHALASSRINKTEEILSPKLKCSIPFSSSKSWFCLIQMLGSPLDIYLLCCHGVDSCIGRLRSQNSGNCQEISYSIKWSEK